MVMVVERALDGVGVELRTSTARAEQMRDELTGIADRLGTINENLDAIEARSREVASVLLELAGQGIA